MKSKIITLIAALFLLQGFSFAADRIVLEGGVTPNYSSITSALVGIPANTRILVFPKSGGDAYIGNLTIPNVAGVQILSAVDGQRFVVQGDISTGTAGNAVISGAETSGKIYLYGTGNRVIGCKVYGYIQSMLYSSLNYIDNDSVVNNGSIGMHRGRVSGCYVEGNITTDGSIAGLTDTTFIVGNHVRILNAGIFSMGVNCQGSNQTVCVANNFIEISGTNAGNGNGIRLFAIKSSASVRSACMNNTIWDRSVTGFIVAGIAVDSASFSVDIENNVFLGNHLGTKSFQFYYPSSDAGGGFRYNYSNISLIDNFTPDGSNNLNANISINPLTGELLTGSDGVDGGNPGDAHRDIDLSRNDAGCYGGSFTRSNFTVAETGVRVLFMTAPRTVFTNTPFMISADGVDK